MDYVDKKGVHSYPFNFPRVTPDDEGIQKLLTLLENFKERFTL